MRCDEASHTRGRHLWWRCAPKRPECDASDRQLIVLLKPQFAFEPCASFAFWEKFGKVPLSGKEVLALCEGGPVFRGR